VFRAGLSRAWTSIAKGLTSNDLRTGEKLAEKTGAFRKKHLLTHKMFRREGGGTVAAGPGLNETTATACEITT
jgi:hypothetical protein